MFEPRDTKFECELNLYKRYMAMKSITIRTGRAGHQRKPMSRLSSLRQLKLTSAYRIGPARAYLVYFTQSWRSLPSMFVFRTIENTPNIIRTRCNNNSSSGPIAEWLEWRARKQGVHGSNPLGGTYFHFEFFAYFPLLTILRSLYKWNQAWHSSRVKGAQR